MEAAIKIENGLAPEALLFELMGGIVDCNGSKAGKAGRSPTKDKRDDKRDYNEDRKEKDVRKGFYCQRSRPTTMKCLSKQCGDSSKSVNSAAKASTEGFATYTLTTSIEN
jgi:hypothetical protein